MRKASGALHFYINGIDQGETLHEETDRLAGGVVGGRVADREWAH